MEKSCPLLGLEQDRQNCPREVLLGDVAGPAAGTAFGSNVASAAVGGSLVTGPAASAAVN